MGIYVKEENQPWNHKQIAGNATGDNALDATSDNNIKNKVVAAKLGNTDISDIGDGTVTGAIVELDNNLDNQKIKSVLLTGTIDSTVAAADTIGYKSSGKQAVNLTTLTGYPTGKNILGYCVEYVTLDYANELGIGAVADNSILYVNTKNSKTGCHFGVRVYYTNS